MGKITKIRLFLILVIFLIGGCAKPVANEKMGEQAQIANPASVYCEENGGTLKIIDNPSGQSGLCTLKDGTECEEWAYYRGECPFVSCTKREECVSLLGVGAFCSSNGKCIPPPKDNYTYTVRLVDCICPDGTRVKVKSDKSKSTCRMADCPGSPTEFTIKDGLVSETIINVSFPLNGKEAKAVAMAACRMSEKVNPPDSSYENIIAECPSAWGFLDETNPCNHTQAFVCDEKAFASCVYGGETEGSGAICLQGQPFYQGEYDEKFIVANPLDLSQIDAISKFRSCGAHDYSGYNLKGELETEREMRHAAISSHAMQISQYAPFDGIIQKYVFCSKGNLAGCSPYEYSVEIRGEHSGPWFFVFDHANLKKGLGVGSRVKAGELISTLPLNLDLSSSEFMDGTEISLVQDISTETVKEQFIKVPPLDYVADEVLADYASYGLTPENTVFSKEYRDAHPCIYPVPPDPKEWISLIKE